MEPDACMFYCSSFARIFFPINLSGTMFNVWHFIVEVFIDFLLTADYWIEDRVFVTNMYEIPIISVCPIEQKDV